MARRAERVWKERRYTYFHALTSSAPTPGGRHHAAHVEARRATSRPGHYLLLLRTAFRPCRGRRNDRITCSVPLTDAAAARSLLPEQPRGQSRRSRAPVAQRTAPTAPTVAPAGHATRPDRRRLSPCPQRAPTTYGRAPGSQCAIWCQVPAKARTSSAGPLIGHPLICAEIGNNPAAASS